MGIAQETVDTLTLLLPGFLAIKVIALRCDLKEQTELESIVNALLYSLAIYALVGLVQAAVAPKIILTDPMTAGAALVVAILFGLLVAEIKNRELPRKLFSRSRFGLSVHDKILYSRGAQVLFGRWHIVGLKAGKECLGIVRAIDTNTQEMLIENARWIHNGQLVGSPQWLYFPPDTELEYITAV